MAVSLTSTLSSTLEPMRKNRWILQVAKVPGSEKGHERLAFAAHTAKFPGMSFNVNEMHRLNEKFYIAGKPTWEECSATFYDYLGGTDSSGHILWQWANNVYNPVTGQMYYKTQYTSSATFAQLDPMGAISRLWNVFYLWPTSVSFGDADYGSDEVVDVSVNFRYDYALKGEDVSYTTVG